MVSCLSLVALVRVPGPSHLMAPTAIVIRTAAKKTKGMKDTSLGNPVPGPNMRIRIVGCMADQKDMCSLNILKRRVP